MNVIELINNANKISKNDIIKLQDMFENLKYKNEDDFEKLKRIISSISSNYLEINEANLEEINLLKELLIDHLCYMEKVEDNMFMLKLICSLIRYSKDSLNQFNDSISLEFAIAECYLNIAKVFINYYNHHFIICVDRRNYEKKLNILYNDNVAIELLLESIKYVPNYDEANSLLSIIYLNNNNYYKSYEYFMNIKGYGEELFDCTGNKYHFYHERDIDGDLFNSLGFVLQQNECFSEAFQVFYKCYLINKHNEIENKDSIILYNLASCYLDGIGVHQNLDKGIYFLNLYIRNLKLNNIDINQTEDPDGIIDRFYFKKCF